MASAQTLESMLGCRKAEQQEKKAKPPCGDEQSALKCPRCDSTNTKFCYYNNYSLSQPRYFCKSCRRYWTKGGTLRNVPVGGGCRRNKRSSSRPARTNQDPLLSSLTSSPIHPPLMPSLATLPYDRPIICNNNVNPACDVLESYGLLGGGGFLQTPATNGLFHSLCYGIGSDHQQSNSVEWNGGNGEIIMGNSSYHQDRICGSGGVKQEVCYGRDEGESRLNWGFPWLLQGGGEGANNSDVIISSSRQSWNENGFGPYSWHHGLINSPLM